MVVSPTRDKGRGRERRADIVEGINVALRFSPHGQLWIVAQQHGAVTPVKTVP